MQPVTGQETTREPRAAMTPADKLILRQNAKRASRLLKALSNEHRLMVLCILAEGEKSVSEIERLVGLSQSALSQHLARLRRDELVRTRRQAQAIFYSLNGEDASRVIGVLHNIYCDAALASASAGPVAVAARG